jgi:hypothetical protein
MAVAGAAAGCSAAPAHDPVATASSPAGAVATVEARASGAPWVDPYTDLVAQGGFTLLAHTGKRTGGMHGDLAAHHAGGTVAMEFECQGQGTLKVTVGDFTADYRCTKTTDGNLDMDAGGISSSAVVYSVEASPGVVWSLAVGWSARTGQPQDS